MAKHPLEQLRDEHLWRKANPKLLPSALLTIAGAVVTENFGGLHHTSFDRKLIAVVGIIIFAVFAVVFLRIITSVVAEVLQRYKLSTGRIAAIVFTLRLIGYGIIFVMILSLLSIPVGKLLLGGAAVGIILGVAAQQALGNFFASIVIIVSHPFYVGEYVTIISGALGGTYIGQIKDIGLTHTKLADESGNVVLLPNATLLSAATITVKPHAAKANPTASAVHVAPDAA